MFELALRIVDYTTATVAIITHNIRAIPVTVRVTVSNVVFVIVNSIRKD